VWRVAREVRVPRSPANNLNQLPPKEYTEGRYTGYKWDAKGRKMIAKRSLLNLGKNQFPPQRSL